VRFSAQRIIGKAPPPSERGARAKFDTSNRLCRVGLVPRLFVMAEASAFVVKFEFHQFGCADAVGCLAEVYPKNESEVVSDFAIALFRVTAGWFDVSEEQVARGIDVSNPDRWFCDSCREKTEKQQRRGGRGINY